MAVRVVRLGTSRAAGEGTRIGTVRRPPRGVPKTAFASQNWYDVWLPNLAPSVETMKLGQEATTPANGQRSRGNTAPKWQAPENSHVLELLATLSHHSRLLGRLLLRARGAVPSLDPARAARRQGRGVREGLDPAR